MRSTWRRCASDPILCWVSAPSRRFSATRALGRKGGGNPVHGRLVQPVRRGDHATGLPVVVLTFRGVIRDFCVANVDMIDAFIDAAIVEVDDVPAPGEDRVDALFLRALAIQVARRK